MGNAPLRRGLGGGADRASAGGVTTMVIGVVAELAATSVGEKTTDVPAGRPLVPRASAAGMVGPPRGVTIKEKLAGLPGLTVGGLPLLAGATTMEKSWMVSWNAALVDVRKFESPEYTAEIL